MTSPAKDSTSVFRDNVDDSFNIVPVKLFQYENVNGERMFATDDHGQWLFSWRTSLPTMDVYNGDVYMYNQAEQ